MDRVELAGEIRLRKPRIDAQLPVAVSAGVVQDVAFDLEADLGRRARRKRRGEPDDQFVLGVIERQGVARLVENAFHAQMPRVQGIAAEDRVVEVELQDPHPATHRGKILGDRYRDVLSARCRHGQVNVGEHEARDEWFPTVAADRLVGKHRTVEAILDLLGLAKRPERLTLVVERIEVVEEVFAAARELDANQRPVGTVETPRRKLMRHR